MNIVDIGELLVTTDNETGQIRLEHAGNILKLKEAISKNAKEKDTGISFLMEKILGVPAKEVAQWTIGNCHYITAHTVADNTVTLFYESHAQRITQPTSLHWLYTTPPEDLERYFAALMY